MADVFRIVGRATRQVLVPVVVAAFLVGPAADVLLSRTRHVWALREWLEMFVAYLCVLPTVGWFVFRVLGVRLALLVSLLGMVLLLPAYKVLDTASPHSPWQYGLWPPPPHMASRLLSAYRRLWRMTMTSRAAGPEGSGLTSGFRARVTSSMGVADIVRHCRNRQRGRGDV